MAVVGLDLGTIALWGASIWTLGFVVFLSLAFRELRSLHRHGQRADATDDVALPSLPASAPAAGRSTGADTPTVA